MEQIPGPYAWPLLGNMLDVRSDEGGLKALENLADVYGPVYQITVRGQRQIIVSSAELLKQVTDEKSFVKIPPPALAGGSKPQGLFTARGDDPDWGQAHRILTPAFGPLPVEDMFDEMMDIASQMCLKWARHESDTQILLTEDFTRLTLDTIALCSMDFRFNSFYQEAMHPFVEAMTNTLGYAGKRNNRPWLYTALLGSQEEARYRANQQVMQNTAQHIIDHRKANPIERDDLLNTMLYATDPKTGVAMRDGLIAANMVTFLVAGHETTSGLLSFAFMQLLKHPHVYLKAQKEVDDVLKGGRIEPKHLKQMRYLDAVLREALRLNPTAPAVTKLVHPDRRNDLTTFCGGKYVVDPETPVRVLLGKSMSDTAYFGDDAREFNPDRMMDTNPQFDHHMAAWKPFGNGSRSCIGQNFAWQEALLVTALVLQNFDLSFVNPQYQLHYQQALTIKPKDLYVITKLRRGVTPRIIDSRLHGTDSASTISPALTASSQSSHSSTDVPVQNEGLTILYGSNSGTCQSLARKLASVVTATLKVSVSTASLDSAVDNLSPSKNVVIVTASYEGQPPDNAKRFVAWLEGLKSPVLKGIRFAVFGCGHKDWHDTLFRIPKLIDRVLEECGAERVYDMGTSDCSAGHILDDFECWLEGLIGQLSGTSTKIQSVNVEHLSEIHNDQRAKQLSNGLTIARVRDVRVLTSPFEPEKCHMEIELPKNMTYECGDYLTILPINPDELVKRIMARWELPWDATITFKSKFIASLPENTPLSVYDILKGYFELSQPVTKRNLESLKEYTNDPTVLAQIDGILSDDNLFESMITSKRTSIFDYLSSNSQIRLPLATFLSWLMPLGVRQYSISSSPLAHPESCTITYRVFRSHNLDNQFEGVASTYLSHLRPGDIVHVAIRQPPTQAKPYPFRLPADISTPLLLYCAGTGLAPFRSFVQHRATLLAANPALKDSLGPALLFVGCRTSDQDRLYAAEFEEWSRLGAVDIRYAFSKTPDKSQGCKYVGERMLLDRGDILKLWQQGARVYICGSRKLLQSIGEAGRKIFEHTLREKNGTEVNGEEIGKRFKDMVSERVVRDVFD